MARGRSMRKVAQLGPRHGRHLPGIIGSSNSGSAMQERQTSPTTVHRPAGRRSLAIIGEAGAATRALPESGVLSLGRAPECEICIPDPRLSRKHLLVQLTPTSVELIDLGSRNGTLLGARRMTPNIPTVLPEGISVSVGSTVFMLQHAHEGARPRRLLTHGYFEARVDEECARASRGGAPFA